MPFTNGVAFVCVVTVLGVGIGPIGPEAYAGFGGHGGGSVVCRDAKGEIKSAELLDLYEARERYNLELIPDDTSVEQIDAIVQKRIEKSPYFNFLLQGNLKRYEKRVHFITEGQKLKLTDDAYPVVLPEDCEVEQLAFDDRFHLMVDPDIYAKLSPLDRYALPLHEAVTSVERKFYFHSKYTTLSRRVVGLLLATALSDETDEGALTDAIERISPEISEGVYENVFNGSRFRLEFSTGTVSMRMVPLSGRVSPVAKSGEALIVDVDTGTPRSALSGHEWFTYDRNTLKSFEHGVFKLK